MNAHQRRVERRAAERATPRIIRAVNILLDFFPSETPGERVNDILKDPEDTARELLFEHLESFQVDDFKKNFGFDMRGADSHLYRLVLPRRWPYCNNIIDSWCNVLGVWPSCIVNHGGWSNQAQITIGQTYLPKHDVLLGQKLGLESDPATCRSMILMACTLQMDYAANGCVGIVRKPSDYGGRI